MPGGRPTVYRSENAEIARQACKAGATNETLARRFAVSRRTIDNWIAAIAEFGDAVREGRAVADLAVVSALFARATGMEQTRTKVFCHRGQPVTASYIEHLPPDVSACMFWLRNRRPEEWRENRPLVHEEDGEAWQGELEEAAARVGAPCSSLPPEGEVEAEQTGSAGIASTASRVSAQYGAKKLDRGTPVIGISLAEIALIAETPRSHCAEWPPPMTAMLAKSESLPLRRAEM